MPRPKPGKYDKMDGGKGVDWEKLKNSVFSDLGKTVEDILERVTNGRVAT